MLSGIEAVVLHVVNRDVAVVIVLVLLGHYQEFLAWRQLHAGYLLHMLWHHDEVHFGGN